MTTIATVSIPADEFVLGETLANHPDVSVEMIRVVAHDSGSVMPLLLMDGGDAERIEELMRNDPTVEGVELLADLEEEQMYNMNWVDRIDILIHVLMEEDGTVLKARAIEGEWTLRILFPKRESLSETYDFCERQGLTFDVETVYEVDKSPQRGQFGLTEDQYRTLVSASRSGYYDVPRDVTMADLAAELGISHQALSERLRRGHGRLVENALLSVGRQGAGIE